jgi:hypothetical protein
VTEKFTLESLRARTKQANRGFADRAAMERADRIARKFQASLAFFEKDAAEYSAKGEHEAIGGEFDDPLDDEDKEVWERLKRHYEGMGFKTRAHRYSDGDFSGPHSGIDLMVDWS